MSKTQVVTDESEHQLTNSVITFNKMSLKLKVLKVGDAIYEVDDVEILLNINLDEGSYNGKSACNNYFGGVHKINEDKVRFDPGGMTEMMCTQDLMKWEARFMNTLVEHEFLVYEHESSVSFVDELHGNSFTFMRIEIESE